MYENKSLSRGKSSKKNQKEKYKKLWYNSCLGLGFGFCIGLVIFNSFGSNSKQASKDNQLSGEACGSLSARECLIARSIKGSQRETTARERRLRIEESIIRHSKEITSTDIRIGQEQRSTSKPPTKKVQSSPRVKIKKKDPAIFIPPQIIEKDKEKYPVMIGGSNEQNEKIRYAWEISKDKTFIYLLKAENGLISHDRRHSIAYWRKGKKYYDFGFCGVSNYYHPKIVNDKRFFTDWKWQLNKCYELYKGGTTFYGRNNIWKVKKYFKWI